MERVDDIVSAFFQDAGWTSDKALIQEERKGKEKIKGWRLLSNERRASLPWSSRPRQRIPVGERHETFVQ